MKTIETLAQLEGLYGEPIPASLTKVKDHITPLYAEWIAACRFVVLSTVGASGTDASPRGDVSGVVEVDNPRTLLLPDWRGNNRLDSLRNIVEDGRVSLMFMVPGSNNVVRVNGHAVLTDDTSMTMRFEQQGKHPRTVIVITVREIYFQCAKALMRSGLWSGDPAPAVPTAGQFISEFDDSVDAESYDNGYADYAQERMW